MSTDLPSASRDDNAPATAIWGYTTTTYSATARNYSAAASATRCSSALPTAEGANAATITGCYSSYASPKGRSYTTRPYRPIYHGFGPASIGVRLSPSGKAEMKSIGRATVSGLAGGRNTY